MIYFPQGEGQEDHEDHEDRWVLTTQTDHAFFSGELLSLWREDGMPEHPRRHQLIFAAREHDNGWREADAAPRVRAEDGVPHDFRSMPDDGRLEIWRRGVERFAHERPYAALLIAWHARELHRHHREDPRESPWVGFLEDLDARCEELQEISGVGAEEAARDYRFVELTDLLSLALCSAWDQTFSLHGYTFRCEGDTLHLDPLPLAGTTSFIIRCRTIPQRRYTGDTDLAMELASARWEQRRVRVA